MSALASICPELTARTDLCAGMHKADACFAGHNGRGFVAKPVVGASCGKARKGSSKRHRPSH